MTNRQGLGIAALGLAALTSSAFAQTAQIEYSRPPASAQAPARTAVAKAGPVARQPAYIESDYVVLSAQGKSVAMPATVVQAPASRAKPQGTVTETTESRVDFDTVQVRPKVRPVTVTGGTDVVGDPAAENVWRVERGALLKDTLEAWSLRAGWQPPIWPADQKEVELGASAEFTGDFASAVYELFKALPPTVKLRPSLFTVNKYFLLEVAP